MTARSLATLALPLFLAVACVEDVGTGKVAAKVAEPAAAAPAAAATAKAAQVPVDTSRSTVKALGAKITAKHPIDFHEWSGAFRVEGDSLVGLEVTIRMASLESDVEKLTEHLKTADFFDVATFPTATFESTNLVAKSGADGATHEVTGGLTLRGVTKQVTFPATIAQKDGEIEALAEFVIDRQDFDIKYPGRPDDLIQDNVVLTIELRGKPTRS